MKAAIVSHVLPPTWSGQAMVIERLLRPFDPDSYILIRTSSGDDRAYVPALRGQLFDVADDVAARPRGALLGRLLRLVRGLRAMRHRTRRIADIVAETRCNVVVGCTGGDLLDIPAAFRASRRARARFVAYYFDYWSQQSLPAIERRAAEWIESWVLRKADAVIVPNEFLAEELRRRYGIACTIVRNACEPSANGGSRSEAAPSQTPRSIVYTGAVYEANVDAFRNLIHAIESTRLDITIHIFSAQTARDLTAHGLVGPLEVHEHRPTNEVLAVQRKADLLFLPLAFTSPYPRIIRTSSPAKMCEYLASGRPILVHAPRGTFVSEYFRKHGCGVVVDEADPVLLGDALRRLLEDSALRSRVTDAAWQRACTDYDLERSRTTFAAAVGLSFPR